MGEGKNERMANETGLSYFVSLVESETSRKEGSDGGKAECEVSESPFRLASAAPPFPHVRNGWK